MRAMSVSSCNFDFYSIRYEMQRSHGLIISSQNLTEVPDEAFLEAKKANVYKVDFSKNKLGVFPAG